jgi:hypothetical protein
MQQIRIIPLIIGLSFAGLIHPGCTPAKTETTSAQGTAMPKPLPTPRPNISTAEQALPDLSRNLDEHPENIDQILARYKTETDPKTLATLGRVIAGYRDADGNRFVRGVIEEIARSEENLTRRKAARELLADLSKSDTSR